jgi:hypothetical protein
MTTIQINQSEPMAAEDAAVLVMEMGGGPAFPFEAGDQILSGMLLRDHFAGLALAGQRDLDRAASFTIRAALAYAQADAMLAERGRKS